MSFLSQVLGISLCLIYDKCVLQTKFETNTILTKTLHRGHFSLPDSNTGVGHQFLSQVDQHLHRPFPNFDQTANP